MRTIREMLALSRIAKPAFCAVLACLFAFAGRSDESGSVAVEGGGVIAYEGASATNWIGGQLVLIFTNADAASSFVFPEGYKTKARILAVGGGGGGGGSANGAGSHDGGGGGGGAGAVIETNGLFSAGSYNVTVGAGGSGGLRAANTKPWESGVDHRGSDGGATEISGAISLSAPGGGGGGGESAGNDGASGGGGSMFRSGSSSHESRSGGSGMEGLGYSGGDGDVDRVGGGGGGAGGAGSAASEGGAGGDGVSSDIAVASGSEPLWYGGGGGGGHCTSGSTTSAAGGAGGGGAGGAGNGSTEIVPVAGTDGLGGGGGGGSRATGGATGGCGAVIVRIEGSWAGGSAIVTDATIDYFGQVSTNWIDGDLLLTFSGAGGFSLPGTTIARILAVGGGGGGGGSANGAGSHDGGGGGGGAGAVIETNGLFSAGSYNVTVGAGGSGGLRAANSKPWESGVDHRGSDGGATEISGAISLSAPGGGGGGGESAGNDGASGGGGSMFRSASATHESRPGGSGMEGLGHSGGDGDVDRVGGGGGGAGGAGSAASEGGAGGAGVTSDIAVPAGSEPLWYGGGGGGGHCTSGSTTSASGGAGGGGAGGAGNGSTEIVPVAGTDGLGGGGGGGSRATGGADGGDGVVIVRISAAMTGELTAPVDPAAIEFDGNAHTSIVSTLFYTVTGDNVGTTAGVYVATATLARSDLRWIDKTGDDATAPVTVTMTINPVPVTFSNLRIRGWLYGTPEESTPPPKCTVSPSWVVPVYEYADSADSETWSSVKPTAAGVHYLRVRAPNDNDYAFTPSVVAFRIANGLGSIYTDYVELTVGGWSGTDPAELTNFPLKVTLAEKLPEDAAYGADELVGFLYSRAGLTGDDIAFTDDDGNVLPYYMEEWDSSGESTVFVRIPLIGSGSQTIRLYWHLRDGQAAPEHAPETVFSDWTEDGAAAVSQPSQSFGLVYKDGVFVNYFTQHPAMDKTSWAAGETPGTVDTPAKFADGDATETVYDSFGSELSGIPASTPGAYRIVFTPDDQEGEFESLSYHIDFAISGDMATDDLSGGLSGEFALTANGRVLLANDDKLSGHAVYGQAYWRDATYSPSIYWTHSGSHLIGSATLTRLSGSQHVLNFVDDDGSSGILWRLYDVVIGNGMVNGAIPSGRCVLPYSSTGLGNDTYANRNVSGEAAQAGNMILRNKIGAVVYSPCYTNGIGTIYFDAVNHTAVSSGSDALCNQIVVEKATATDDGSEPTDANAGWNGSSPANISTWTPVAMLPLKRDGSSSFAAEDETKTLSLGIANSQTSGYFYRVCAKVEERGAVRFRIRRVSRNDDTGTDSGNFILLDNIIVSYPSCDASLAPYGKHDATRAGKQTLGQECAMANVPFPSVSDAATLLARGSLSAYVSPVSEVSAASFVQSAAIKYRWRYLNQSFYPSDGSWNSVELNPRDGYAATVPLDVPTEPGDIEFWYELGVSMPYYSYTDYSGLGVALGGLYTEEKSVVTNRMASSTMLPTTGTDWYVRLREGASDLEDVTVTVYGAYSAEQKMELIGDQLWRGLVKVPTNASGTVSFYFTGTNRQTPGADDFEENTTEWYPTADVSKLPSRGEVSTVGEPRSYEADTASGYIEFTYNDSSKTFYIGHAEYQDFNAWHDAYGEKFVGTYADTSGVSTATMVQTNVNMSAWSLLETSSGEWNESFELVNYLDAGYPKGVEFSTHKMPHNWNGANGMFVDAYLTASNQTARMEGSGIAWQMKSGGEGNVSFTQSGPSGLDTLTFQARLAQGISFDDFSVWCGDGSYSTNNYTLVTPALLSYATSSPSVSPDYAPGASMSVVGYYRAKTGCYELRAERNSTDGVQLSIYKWYVNSKYKMVCTNLVTHWFKNATFEHANGATRPNMYAMLLSLGQDNSGTTTIIGGLSAASYAPSDSYSGRSYNLVCVQDSADNRHTAGTYGVLSANCNGMFHYPRQRGSRIASSGISNFNRGYNTQSITLPGDYNDTVCYSRLADAWAYTPGRAEYAVYSGYTSTVKPCGIRPPEDLEQTVDVYVKPAGSSSDGWGLVDQVAVSGYNFSGHEVVVRTNADCHVMLSTGEYPVDATIWKITQTSWNGEDIPNIGNLPNAFVYTQARIVDEADSEDASVTNRYAMLQPARAVPGKALSIRSPVLEGLGMVSFSYKNVRPGCEVWVQAATNGVPAGLSGTLGYNYTTNEVAVGEAEPYQSWITLRKFSYDELAADSLKLHSCGWHTSESSPLRGVFRIVVAPSVVAAAQAVAADDPEWGSITITDMAVHDEPELDSKSWIGWNIRTLGDGSDGEKRMYLPDAKAATGVGLSSGLNNSASDDIAGDESEYDDVDPAIQSPTFGEYAVADSEGNISTNTATIGQIRFRARLYETNSAAASAGTVALYGTMDGAGGTWTALTNFTVESTVYRTFEYKATGLDRFAAVRFAIDGVADGSAADAKRVLFDEIVVSERVAASVGFEYARPFRSGLNVDKEITNILSPDQQPLAGETWGVQAKLRFDRYDADIDTNRAFRVFFRYFAGEDPWGYDNWTGESGATDWAELVQVGEPTNYIFRSSASVPASLVTLPPSFTAGTVQYMLYAQYYLKSIEEPQTALIQQSQIEGEEWTNPSWYEPVDFNTDAKRGNGTAFSPYTILDPVSPGRVWINEVNYNDGSSSSRDPTNEFVEIAVPWGVDLKGWRLVLTDMNLNTWDIAKLGSGSVPSSKKSANRSGDYDFLVIQSPATRDAGGMRGADGTVVADGTWYNPGSGSGVPATYRSGTLQYFRPYQLELVRPSGIIEHQFVIGGTNLYAAVQASFDAYGYLYEGTNLVKELDAVSSSEKRFFAGKDNDMKSDGSALSSLGVSGSAHGEEGGWSADMKFTPGFVNENQDELSGWYQRPNGSAIWIYAKSESSHITQVIGDDTAQDTYVIVNSGNSTNITYSIDPWYAIGALTVNGVTNAAGVSGSYTLNLNNITETTYVVASEGIDARLADAGYDASGRYANEIVEWLAARHAAGTLKKPDGPISLGKYMGLWSTAEERDMTLEMMYWFDLDPTDPGWWLRFGITGIAGSPVYRKHVWNSEFTEHYTNRLVTVKMYYSNDTDRAEAEVYAPYRLQGLGNVQSDSYSGNWTSVTWQVKIKLNNGLELNAGFLPFRWFTFAPGSFSSDTYESRIEILDPFALSSVGYNYGWYGNPCNSLLYRFVLDDSVGTGAPVETLKADMTYDGKLEDDN